MAIIRSILFLLVFYPGSVLPILYALATVPLGQERLVRASQVWARWHRWCARHILGIRTQLVGELPQSGVLIALKHESMFETADILVLLDRPAVVLKQELLKIPGWGAAARRHGVIPVDREAGASAMRAMIAAAKAAKAAGRPVLIFPEGTRALPGEKLPLRPGFAGLYKMLGLPVVPVALDSGRLWPRGLIRRPGIVTMQVGEIIPPGLPREEIEARVHAAINALNQ